MKLKSIEEISGNIAETIHENYPEGNVGVMKFALINYISNILIVCLSFAIGWVIGMPSEVMIALLSVAAMRYMTGGRHMKTASGCVIVSTVVIVLIPLIPFSKIFTIMAFVLVSMYGEKKNFKYAALAIILMCYFVDNDILATSFFIQSLTLIPSRRG